MELSSIANLQCDIFINALSACASSSCIQQIGNLINSRLITNEFIFSSLAMLSNPTIDIINSIATFIDNIPFNGFLAISSLVQSYCITHSNCQMELSVQRIIHSISSKLPSNCYVGQEFDEIKVRIFQILLSVIDDRYLSMIIISI
ncbi:unnamed protein product [Brugia pahangi]|uniref:Vitellogenin domain-containing protein n=1 Tax=Brugia pahangi TaxID=6280 RepID=A0A0N4THK4_BRUPA|nr:unnamed protein product [Brugia pahangi]